MQNERLRGNREALRSERAIDVLVPEVSEVRLRG
jgi:hypothetical protein